MMEQGFNYPAVLDKFRHGFRTNLETGVMTNQDAVLLILNANSGTMHKRQIIDAMLRWRFGEIVYERRKVTRWDEKQGKYVPDGDKSFPKLGFSYLFNGSNHSGYGFVAPNVYSRGRKIRHSGFTSAAYKRIREKKSDWETEMARGKGYHHHKAWRRHFWYRSARGTYSMTLEAFRRLAELGFTNN